MTHDCPACGMACYCDGDDTWMESEWALAHCAHDCDPEEDDLDYGSEDDGSELAPAARGDETAPAACGHEEHDPSCGPCMGKLQTQIRALDETAPAAPTGPTRCGCKPPCRTPARCAEATGETCRCGRIGLDEKIASHETLDGIVHSRTGCARSSRAPSGPPAPGSGGEA